MGLIKLAGILECPSLLLASEMQRYSSGGIELSTYNGVALRSKVHGRSGSYMQ